MSSQYCQTEPYRHQLAGLPVGLPPGKAVCVGRNYAEHARELNNPIPDSPLLFIKPATAMVAMSAPVQLPGGRGACHHELEVALLIGAPLRAVTAQQALAGVAGYGLALDLTLRELQDQLKSKGQPWERAKAFDGALPLSPFVAAEQVGDWRELELELQRNGAVQQRGCCRDMLFGLDTLLADISQTFTLLPGDVVLTGTPAGVGPLLAGDLLRASLRCSGDELVMVETRVG